MRLGALAVVMTDDLLVIDDAENAMVGNRKAWNERIKNIVDGT